jgi:hypothetical protein
MGYDIHITRKARWSDNDGPTLTLEEWLDYVSRDEEMRADGFAETATPNGEIIRIENPGIAVWTAYSGHGVDEKMAWFCHFKDRITVKNPDTETVRKMHKIATFTGARVQGDEGEEYDANGEIMQSAFVTKASGSSAKMSWWRFWQ